MNLKKLDKQFLPPLLLLYILLLIAFPLLPIPHAHSNQHTSKTMPHRLAALFHRLVERLTNKKDPLAKDEDEVHATPPSGPGFPETPTHEPHRVRQAYASCHKAEQEQYDQEKYEQEQYDQGQEEKWTDSEQEEGPPWYQQQQQQQQQKQAEGEGEAAVGPSSNQSTVTFNISAGSSSSLSSTNSFSSTRVRFPGRREYKRQVKRALFEGLTERESEPKVSPIACHTWALAFHSLAQNDEVAVGALKEGKDAHAPARETAQKVVEAIERKEERKRQGLEGGCACM